MFHPPAIQGVMFWGGVLPNHSDEVLKLWIIFDKPVMVAHLCSYLGCLAYNQLLERLVMVAEYEKTEIRSDHVLSISER